MQSSSAKRSKLWSGQWSGDHEETVQVPHTQRVCAQNKGTTSRRSFPFRPTYLKTLFGLHEIVQMKL